MHKSQFIVIEGLEGAGKSTAIATVNQVLTELGIEQVHNTREPGGTPLAEQMRDMVKLPNPEEELTVQSELLLMYAARSQLIEHVIKPALANNEWVVGDRHDLSSVAYQGGGRQLNTMLQPIRQAVLGDFRPDLTLYLDIDPQLGLDRARQRGALDRIEQQELAFFTRARNAYKAAAAADENIVTVDASQELEAVQDDIRKVLFSRLGTDSINASTGVHS